MEHQSEINSGVIKTVILPGTGGTADTPWGKTEKPHDAPAPPPVWTRYIDSRLKQFCVR
jgi:hypothetical protein